PGTGKTRTLTHRIAYLCAEMGVAPRECLAITFTRRAAEEMRARLDALLGEPAQEVTVTTFHSLGLRILRENPAAAGLEPDFTVVDAMEGEDGDRTGQPERLSAVDRRPSGPAPRPARARRVHGQPASVRSGPPARATRPDQVTLDDLVRLP